MSYEPQFDDMLFAILNHVGAIDKLLDVVFSFLYRRTDFYKVRKCGADKFGLPPGVAQKMVKMINQKYVKLESAINMAKTKEEQSSAEGTDNKEAAVGTDKEKAAVKKSASVKMDSAAEDCDKNKQMSSSKIPEESLQNNNKDIDEIAEKCVDEAEGKPEKPEGDTEEKPLDSAESDDPERRYYAADPECYNGASYDNYSWAQDIYVLDVHVKVPEGVKRGEQVKVDIQKKHLKVEALQDDKWQVLLDGALSYDVKLGGSTWTLHPDDHVHVELEKGYERYWEALLEGEPKINVRAIDCSKPYEDLEEEAQAKLQEMMFDQHQKFLGKPTSKQIKVQEMMKKAWNTKDSPFRGQEFDPSQFTVAD